MKKSKTIWKSIGALGAIVAPVAIVVACSNQEVKGENDVNSLKNSVAPKVTELLDIEQVRINALTSVANVNFNDLRNNEPVFTYIAKATDLPLTLEMAARFRIADFKPNFLLYKYTYSHEKLTTDDKLAITIKVRTKVDNIPSSVTPVALEANVVGMDHAIFGLVRAAISFNFEPVKYNYTEALKAKLDDANLIVGNYRQFFIDMKFEKVDEVAGYFKGLLEFFPSLSLTASKQENSHLVQFKMINGSTQLIDEFELYAGSSMDDLQNQISQEVEFFRRLSSKPALAVVGQDYLQAIPPTSKYMRLTSDVAAQMGILNFKPKSKFDYYYYYDEVQRDGSITFNVRIASVELENVYQETVSFPIQVVGLDQFKLELATNISETLKNIKTSTRTREAFFDLEIKTVRADLLDEVTNLGISVELPGLLLDQKVYVSKLAKSNKVSYRIYDRWGENEILSTPVEVALEEFAVLDLQQVTNEAQSLKNNLTGSFIYNYLGTSLTTNAVAEANFTKEIATSFGITNFEPKLDFNYKYSLPILSQDVDNLNLTIKVQSGQLFETINLTIKVRGYNELRYKFVKEELEKVTETSLTNTNFYAIDLDEPVLLEEAIISQLGLRISENVQASFGIVPIYVTKQRGSNVLLYRTDHRPISIANRSFTVTVGKFGLTTTDELDSEQTLANGLGGTKTITVNNYQVAPAIENQPFTSEIAKKYGIDGFVPRPAFKYSFSHEAINGLTQSIALTIQVAIGTTNSTILPTPHTISVVQLVTDIANVDRKPLIDVLDLLKNIKKSTLTEDQFSQVIADWSILNQTSASTLGFVFPTLMDDPTVKVEYKKEVGKQVSYRASFVMDASIKEEAMVEFVEFKIVISEANALQFVREEQNRINNLAIKNEVLNLMSNWDTLATSGTFTNELAIFYLYSNFQANPEFTYTYTREPISTNGSMKFKVIVDWKGITSDNPLPLERQISVAGIDEAHINLIKAILSEVKATSLSEVDFEKLTMAKTNFDASKVETLGIKTLPSNFFTNLKNVRIEVEKMVGKSIKYYFTRTATNDNLTVEFERFNFLGEPTYNDINSEQRFVNNLLKAVEAQKIIIKTNKISWEKVENQPLTNEIITRFGLKVDDFLQTNRFAYTYSLGAIDWDGGVGFSITVWSAKRPLSVMNPPLSNLANDIPNPPHIAVYEIGGFEELKTRNAAIVIMGMIKSTDLSLETFRATQLSRINMENSATILLGLGIERPEEIDKRIPIWVTKNANSSQVLFQIGRNNSNFYQEYLTEYSFFGVRTNNLTRAELNNEQIKVNNLGGGVDNIRDIVYRGQAIEPVSFSEKREFTRTIAMQFGFSDFIPNSDYTYTYTITSLTKDKIDLDGFGMVKFEIFVWFRGMVLAGPEALDKPFSIQVQFG